MEISQYSDVFDIKAMFPFGSVQTLDYADLDAELDALEEICLRDEPSFKQQGLEQRNGNKEESVQLQSQSLESLPFYRSEPGAGMVQSQSVPCQHSPAFEKMISLLNSELWKRFCNEKSCNEMAVSKRGRTMFPSIHVAIRGLNPDKMYSIFLDFPLHSRNVWKYRDGEWGVSRSAEESLLLTCGSRVEHPLSPRPGYYWLNLKEGIEFKKAMLTNDSSVALEKKHVYLKTCHKYQPRVNVVEVDTLTGQRVWSTLMRYSFSETAFIAVTNFRNPKMNKLKMSRKATASVFQTDSLNSSVSLEQEANCLKRPLLVPEPLPDPSFLDFSDFVDLSLDQYEPEAKRPRLFYDEDYIPDFSVLTD